MKIFITWIFLFMSSAYAGPKVTVDVPGMVCQMCVFGMKKNFKSVVEDNEKDVIVDLEKKTVTLNLKSKISDEEIKKRVSDAGYNAKSITWID